MLFNTVQSMVSWQEFMIVLAQERLLTTRPFFQPHPITYIKFSIETTLVIDLLHALLGLRDILPQSDENLISCFQITVHLKTCSTLMLICNH
jgi:hypothetical protein